MTADPADAAGAEPGRDLAREVHRLLARRDGTVAVAESLTGGLLGAALTDMPGSSATFVGGVIAYATELKTGLLDVPAELLAAHGAVHPEVARAMAAGVRVRLRSSYGLAVTGVAGPEPQDGQPVGTVYAAVASRGRTVVERLFSSSPPGGSDPRGAIRRLTVVHALDLLRKQLLE